MPVAVGREGCLGVGWESKTSVPASQFSLETCVGTYRSTCMFILRVAEEAVKGHGPVVCRDHVLMPGNGLALSGGGGKA